jgi:hypothetical protein
MPSGAERSHYDNDLKSIIESHFGAQDAQIQELFQQFLPSYTLDYAAPARLGLAAFICARRPELLAAIFQLVAQDYFQLGVRSGTDFREQLRWVALNQQDILTKHGEAQALHWLEQHFEMYREILNLKFAELEKEFRAENGGT